MNSPNVFISEINNKVYVPKDINEIAAYVGYFEKGPINQPVLITDLLQFKSIFGRGIDLYHNDWYQVYNYLQYSSAIWVCRSAGTHQWNASNNGRDTILDKEDFDNSYENFETKNGFRVFAKQPGEYGNLYTITCITLSEWSDNVILYGTTRAKDVFSFFEDNNFGICLFRKNVLLESYYLDETTIHDINKENSFLYWKIDYEDITPFYNSTAHKLSEGSVNLSSQDNLLESHELFKSKENYYFDIIIGNEFDNSMAISVADYRRDCIAFIGLPTKYIEWLNILMGDKSSEILYAVEGIPIAIKEFKHKKRYSERELKNLNDYIASMQQSQFCHFTMNVKEQYDGFTQKNKLVNIAGDTAGLKAQAANKTPWSASAGLERGQIKNFTSIYINFDKNTHNSYYKRGLNFIENGVLMTQKTYLSKETAFNRVNVRALFNYIEKSIEYYIKRFVFEENSYNKRRLISSEIKRILEEVRLNRGIQSAKSYVTTHPDNENNILITIEIKPIYVAEYIVLKLANVGTNQMTEIIS